MMLQAIKFVMDAFAGGVSQFGRILNAIPGSQALIIAAFFLTVTVGMLIMPLRGGRFVSQGGDLSSESISEVTSTTYDKEHPDGYDRRTVTHTRTTKVRH